MDERPDSGLTGLEIDRAMDVDALAPTRLLNREILLARRPATGGPRGMGRMHRVGEQHGLVVGQRVQDFFIVRDESLLLFLVELTRDDLRLVIFAPRASKNGYQFRAPRVDVPDLLLNPGPDRARRARQRRRDPGLQVFL